MNHIQLELLRIFCAIAQAGSISKASESLFVSQSAVSRSIQRLEQQLGYPLFVRNARGVSLTKEGEILYKYAKPIFHYLSEAEKEIQEIHNILSGEIRIGISASLCKYFLMPYLNQFNKKYPGIVIRITNPTTPEIIHLMKKEEIDIGIVNLPIADDELHIKELIQLEDCFIVGEKYKEIAMESPIPLAQLQQYPMLMLEKKSNTRKYMDRYFKEQGIEFKPEVELGNLDLLVEFAMSGLGVACVIKNFIQNELENDKVFEVKIKEGIPQRSVSVSHLKAKSISAVAERFLKMLTG